MFNLHCSNLSLQAALTKKFNVKGIPVLILLNGATGETISIAGRSITAEDPNGEDFPWLPRPVLEDLKGTQLHDSDKINVDFEKLIGKTLGLFFHCHTVSTIAICIQICLALIYNTVNSLPKRMQLIF